MDKTSEQYKTLLKKEKTAREIAENKLETLENDLVNKERENRLILQSISDTVLVIDSNGKIKPVGPQRESMFFNAIKQKKEQSIQTVFNEALARKFDHAVKKCLVKGNSEFNFQKVFQKNTGYFVVKLVKLDKDKALAVIRDVTELNHQKNELQQARSDAEAALRSKSEFLSNVSHEIRTPLNAILGFSQWLYENTSTPQHSEYLTTILQSARSLLNLLNDILDLSKIESGKIYIDVHPMNYLEVVNDIKLVFQKKVKEKGLSLEITTDATVPDFIYMDEIRFYQILFNLVSNSIKFTKKGNVHISAHATKTEKEDEINLIISVEDTGIGIKENQQKNIFSTFTQQSGQANRTYEGTGLGLAIVNGLLKKLNGSIRVESKPGKGSIFTVTFFNVKVDRTDNIRIDLSKEGASMKLDPCTIMITDDIQYNIMVLKQLINSEDVTFIEASDGTDALAKLKTEKPDIIFMDIRMPGISGFDTTELIKQDKELKHIPVIAFTASTIKDHNNRINSLFDGFLQKPVFKKELNALLKRFLKYSFVEKNSNE